jgi:hypothetical protein
LESCPDDKINWRFLSENPGIFVYDYAAMRGANAALHEELIRTVFHPERISKFLAGGGDLDDL